MLIRNLDKGIAWALPLSLFLHGTGLLLADVSKMWLPIASGYSDAGAQVRLEAVLQSEQGAAIGAMGDAVSTLDPAEHPKAEPESEALMRLGRAGEEADLAGGRKRSVSEDYLPRSKLSVPPVPLQEITVQWPGERTLPERVAVIFILHIDELGVVREVIPDTRKSLPDLDEAVEKAFLGARFRPGQIGGHPVRSRIRIEVVFESVLPPPNPVVVSERKSL